MSAINYRDPKLIRMLAKQTNLRTYQIKQIYTPIFLNFVLIR